MSSFRAEIITLTFLLEFVVPKLAGLRFLLTVASGLARADIVARSAARPPFVQIWCAALNRPTSTGGSLPQMSETANSTGLNRCLISAEFVSE